MPFSNWVVRYSLSIPVDLGDEIFINTVWLTYSCTCLHCVVVNVTSNAFISGLIRRLKFTNHKFAGKFVGGDVIDDGHADVILVPRDCGKRRSSSGTADSERFSNTRHRDRRRWCWREDGKYWESNIIDHFTVVCSVTWPLTGSEAGGDLTLLQTSLLLSRECTKLVLEQLDFHNKSSEVCIKTRSPLASLPFKGQVTERTTVKWSIAHFNSLHRNSPLR